LIKKNPNNFSKNNVKNFAWNLLAAT